MLSERQVAVSSSRVLVVGAGGIGCELLKNLVLTSFKTIDVVGDVVPNPDHLIDAGLPPAQIDLDTIDISNLNRQFLFRKCHVSMSKAHVAREAALKFNPNVTIESHHSNIKDQQFGAAFFKQFDLVMNALDNVDARRHINRLCLALDIPLIESGTQGYLGQVATIRKGRTECFECQPRDAPKTFAVCTIRNTPDQPVHCVVWAKFVLGMLFGPHDPDNIMLDRNADDGADSHQEGDAQEHWTRSLFQSGSASDQARIIFNHLYHDDIVQAAAVKDRWRTRAAPVPVNPDQMLLALDPDADKRSQEPGNAGPGLRDQRVPSVSECVRGLLRTVTEIIDQRASQIGRIEFDKDDDLLMECVSYLANLRMHCFHIALQSRFSIKGIAGNIVHAIATTNAIAAGLMVIEGIKVLTGDFSQCRTTWIKRYGPRILQPQRIDPPNPACFVCNRTQAALILDTDATTLIRLFKEVCRGALGLNEPAIDVVNRDNFIGSEADHVDDEDSDDAAYLERVLSDPGVRINDGAILSIDDLTQQLSLELVVHHQDGFQGFSLDRGNSFVGKKRARDSDPITDKTAGNPLS